MKQPSYNQHENAVIIPTAPGANPSSFPDFSVPVTIESQPQNEAGNGAELPGGSRIAPNGAVIEEPMDTVPEILPPHRYTPEKEDLDLLIM